MSPRTLRLGAVAIAVATALTCAPGPADAATKKRGVSAKVARKTLTITGSGKADKIVVRAGRRRTAEVDVGGNSRAEFRFSRRSFRKIAIRAGRGADRITLADGLGPATADGAAGSDRLIVVGTKGADSLAAGRAGKKLRASRAGRRQVDASRVEVLEFDPLGGADAITLNDLTGTGVNRVQLALAGDGAPDGVVVNGTAGDDTLAVAGEGSTFGVAGLRWAIAGSGADAGGDRLTVNGGAGADSIGARALAGNAIALSADGGPGDDTMGGGRGADALGGGPGDDVFRWEPGDGPDRFDGQDGTDRLAAGGTDGRDNFAVTPTAAGLRLARDDGAVEATRVEGADLAPRGGADHVTVDGTGAGDAIGVTGGAGGVSVSGPAPTAITGAEAADALTLLPAAGSDNVDASRLGADGPALSMQGGAGADLLTGGAGGDTFVSDATDSGDTVNGGDGADRVAFTATDGPDAARFTHDGARSRLLLGGVLQVDGGAVETFGVNALGGGDDFTVDGTGGDDTFTVAAGAGNLSVAGSTAALDVARTDDNGDRLTINAGEGADTVDTAAALPLIVEGGGGTGDRVVVSGTDADEAFGVAPSAARLRLTRGADTIDADDVENVTVSPRGGADTVNIADLTGTDVTKADADLAAAPGGSADGQPDRVTRNAPNGDDVVATPGNATGGVNVGGLPAPGSIDHTDPADALTINLNGGEDVLDASGLPAGRAALAVNGGVGGDVIIGSQGDDFIDGGDGDDVALEGAGNDTFRWEPGDDNDTIEGQSGANDTLVFVENNVSEEVDIEANGGRIRMFRNVANVTMDMNDVERIDVATLGGTDKVTVDDVSGTDLRQVNADLAGAGGAAGDGAADNVVLNGNNLPNQITVRGSAAVGVIATGLTTSLSIRHGEVPNDRLTVNSLGDNDGVGAGELTADAIRLTLDGGAGLDVLTGGAGDDQIIGGPGSDFLFGGPGVDTFDNDPSDFQQQD